MNGDDAQGRDAGGTGSRPGDDMSRRLDRLGADLDAKRHEADAARTPPDRSASNTTAVGQAFRLSAEFVSGVIAGGIIGWLVDRFAGTSPWGLIVCVILGFCAGMLNLLRSSGALKPARTRNP